MWQACWRSSVQCLDVSSVAGFARSGSCRSSSTRYLSVPNSGGCQGSGRYGQRSSSFLGSCACCFLFLRSTLSWLFAWKLFLLVALLLICLVVYRPFCRYFCPLGALYGMGNHLSPIRLCWDERKCTHCGRCHVACPMDLDPARSGQMSLCIRCGKCAAACPEGALSLTTRRCSAGSKVPAQGAAPTDA